ncbi:AraC family transcriptional regulator [Steroidobacter sp. S1-65]|uniref:AraC family transcriptional regulator n=1 Tax=Steroidobacter gossypii TaxID=2805490 RepID=A0ABS1WRV1_9GAMM|nr:AraC family transcriptional regulator [Steroidobacter gossypii]MBM0103673.1 AraC family transcriptional regulator [Steroidobacter gossypii]
MSAVESSPESPPVELPNLDQQQAELAALVTRLAPGEGMHPSAIPGLTIMRANSPSTPTPSLYEPSLCIVVQGRKRAMVGDEVYYYDALNYLTVSVTLPAIGHVLEATADKPYLCLRLELDARMIGELLLQVGRSAVPPSTDRGLYVARTSPPLLDAVLRLTRLLEQPRDAAILAPLVLREIHYRVLTGELGHRLRELCVVDSQVNRVARAIELLRKRFTESLRIEDLAAAAHMSESSLHHRFKAVTAMSPMQFQKQLRLHEARRLMLMEGLEAAAAAHRVGYESPSQFSREYRRLFGAPPRREIQTVRGGGLQPA